MKNTIFKTLKIKEVEREMNENKRANIYLHEAILIQRATDMQLEDILQQIAKNKSVEEIKILIEKYNNLELLNHKSKMVQDSKDTIFYYVEDEKDILIDSLVKLKEKIKGLSKTQSDKDFEESCTDIHYINTIINNLEDLFENNTKEEEIY